MNSLKKHFVVFAFMISFLITQFCFAFAEEYEQVPLDTSSISAVLEARGLGATGYDVIASGSCGADVMWELNITGTLTISGTGRMKNSSSILLNPMPWNYYTNWIQSIIIKSGVKSIGNYAFYNCVNLKSISIPSSVTSIGYYAFYDCVELTSIKIPSGVTSIGYNAFYNCSSLSSIEVPSSVTSIGHDTFYGCSKLKTAGPIGSGCSYEFGWSASIPSYAFYRCSGLTSIEIPSGVTSIGSYAFQGCSSLKNITLPAGLSIIENYTFYGAGLTAITIPGKVSSIGENAFWGCTYLKNITFSGNAPRFGNSCFKSVNATACYFAGTSGWTNPVLTNYGGNIVWKMLEATENPEAAKIVFDSVRNFYFEDSTELGINPEVLNAVTAETLSGYQQKSAGSLTNGITYEGVSLTLNDTITERYFFIVADSIEKYSFKINGKTVKAVPNGQYYTVDVEGIPFEKLNQWDTVEVQCGSAGWSVSYCPLSYAYKALATGTDENLSMLMKAMYLYNLSLNP